jgi:hypothetical protein
LARTVEAKVIAGIPRGVIVVVAGVTPLLLWIGATLPVRAQQPPAILQITIERLEPGREAQYADVEQRLLEVCTRLGCPNAYLALESVAAPKEVWWLIMYESAAEVERVGNAYAANQPLLDSMRELQALKTGISAVTGEHMTKLQVDSGDASPWRVASEPFAVIATTTDGGRGTVFAAPDGTRFSLVSAPTRVAAEVAAAELGENAKVFEARPEWSKPEIDWIAANPELWR